MAARPSRRRAIALVGAAALLVGCCWLIYPHARAGWLLSRAERNLQEYDFAAARRDLTAVLTIWPDSARSHFQMASVCRREGDAAGAAKHLQQAHRLGWVPDAIGLEKRLAVIQVSGPREGEGAALLDFARKATQESALVLEAMFEGYRAIAYHSEAKKIAALWSNTLPRDWRPHFLLAKLLAGYNRYDEARLALDKAIALRPKNEEVLKLQAILMVASNVDIDGARAILDRHLAKHPFDVDAMLAAADCRNKMADRAGARALLERLVSHDPANAAACVCLAALDTDEERFPEALEWLRRAAEASPGVPDVYFRRAGILRRLSRTEEAEHQEQRFRELEEIQRTVAATRIKVLDEPENPELRFRLGRLYLQAGMTMEAESWLLSTLRQDPNYRPAHETLVELYEKQGRRDSAAHHRRSSASPVRRGRVPAARP